MATPLNAFAQKGNNRVAHTLELTVKDKDDKEPIIMATIQLQPTGMLAVTNADGKATLRNIDEGNYTVNVSYVGYETLNINVKVNKNLKMTCQLVPTTLALQEVNVVARQKAGGASTTSVIGRQAIDHLQAASLAETANLRDGTASGPGSGRSQSQPKETATKIARVKKPTTAAFRPPPVGRFSPLLPMAVFPPCRPNHPSPWPDSIYSLLP